MDNGDNYYRIFLPEQKGDLYLTVETYPAYTVPDKCTTGLYYSGGRYHSVSLPIVRYQVYTKNGQEIESFYGQGYYQEQFPYSVIIPESDYRAGKTLIFYVKYEWMGSPAPDYTVSVYSKQNLEVVDKNNMMRIVHMDGQSPSGFTDSSYSGMDN